MWYVKPVTQDILQSTLFFFSSTPIRWSGFVSKACFGKNNQPMIETMHALLRNRQKYLQKYKYKKYFFNNFYNLF